jgi:ribosomal protein L11 methyltransferase
VSNAEANGVEISLERLDVREQAPPVAPTVVANLTANLLRDCAVHLAADAQVPKTLVCSGMLESETDEVAAAFAGPGLEERERRSEGEWAALLLRRSV